MFVLHFHTESNQVPYEYIVLLDDSLSESEYKDAHGQDGYALDIYDVSDGSGWEEWPAPLPTDRNLRAF